MADVFSKKERSRCMSRIRSRSNEETELKLVAILRLSGIHGWRRHVQLPGRPDFTFRRERLVVFVDGCFWHKCPQHGRQPSSNPEYWIPKLARNQQRDREVTRELRRAGWRVLRLWEHELKSTTRVAARINKFLSASLKTQARSVQINPR